MTQTEIKESSATILSDWHDRNNSNKELPALALNIGVGKENFGKMKVYYSPLADKNELIHLLEDALATFKQMKSPKTDN